MTKYRIKIECNGLRQKIYTPQYRVFGFWKTWSIGIPWCKTLSYARVSDAEEFIARQMIQKIGYKDIIN